MKLNSVSKGSGETIVFLHGMASSLNYWASYIDTLSKSYRVIAVDLLGFGLSPQTADKYTVENHCNALFNALENLDIHGPIILVGHSMGALLALKYALMHPRSISHLVLLNMPVFISPEQAQSAITQNKRILRYLYYGSSSHILCTIWCYYLRPLSRRLAPLYLPSKSRQVARDSVMHTWRAYSESMAYIIEQQSVQDDLDKLSLPVRLIFGDTEYKTSIKNAKALRLKADVELKIIPGSHNLPLESPLEVTKFITDRKEI